MIFNNGGTFVDLSHNWWGNNTPTWSLLISNDVVPANWIYASIPSNVIVKIGDSLVSIPVSFNYVTDGATVSQYDNTVLDGSNVTFVEVSNNLGSSTTGMVTSGQTSITYTLPTTGKYEYVLNLTGDYVPGVINTTVIYERPDVIYVSDSLGSDDNVGNKTSPLKTLEAALKIATAEGGKGQIIVLNGTYTGTGNVGIEINGNVTITGESMDNVTFDAKTLSNIFNITTGSNVNLTNITLVNGKTTEYGSVINNNGNLTMNNTRIINNTAINSIVYNNGTDARLNITNSIILNNTVGTDGYVIYNNNSNIVDLSHNWWGNNTPDWSVLTNNTVPANWIYASIPSNVTVKIGDASVSIPVNFNYIIDTNGLITTYNNKLLDRTNVTFTEYSTYGGSSTIETIISGQTSITYTLPTTGKFSYILNLTSAYLTGIMNTTVFYERPDVIYVSNFGDDTNVGNISSPMKTLEAAIAAATGYTGKGKIVVLDGTYTGEGNVGINITGNVNITGQSVNGVIFNAEGNSNLFNVTSDSNVNITNITLKNGKDTAGGAINNNGNLTLNNTILINNTATNGGVIYNNYNLTIINSILENNTATDGGAIYNDNYGYLTIQNSSLNNNTATIGGAIYNIGKKLNVTESTFNIDNATTNGGAIYSTTAVILTNNKFTNVTAGDETLWLTGTNTLSGNTYVNDSINFKALTVSANSPVYIFDTIPVTISSSLLHPTYYDSDILTKNTYSVYVNDEYNKTITGISTSYSLYAFESGNITTYLVPSISSTQSNTLKIIVKLLDTNIKVTPENATVAKEINITSTLTNSTGDPITHGTITYIINGKTYDPIEVTSTGIVELPYTFEKAGNYTIITTYNDTTNTQMNRTVTTTIEIFTVRTSMLIGTVQDKANQTVNLTVTLTDIDNNKAVIAGNVTFYVNGVKVGVDDVNSTGQASIEYIFPHAGSYKIDAVYNDTDNVYHNNTAVRTVVINRISTQIIINPIISNVTDVTNITVKITDTKGNPVKSGNVTIVINGTSYGPYEITGDNGTIVLEHIFTKLGDYNVTAYYDDNGAQIYNNRNASTIAEIYTKETSISIATNITNPNGNITVKIKDLKGNPVEFGNVTLYVDGNPVSNSTGGTIFAVDTTGILYANYTFTAGEHTITAVYNDTNNIYSNNTATTTSDIQDLTSVSITTNGNMVNKTINITATVTDSYGDIVKEGNITFYIDGSTDPITDPIPVNENGTAMIQYTFAKYGNHTIKAVYTNTTTSYKNSKGNTTITINPINIGVTVVTAYSRITVAYMYTANVTDIYGNRVRQGNIAFYAINSTGGETYLGTGPVNSQGTANITWTSYKIGTYSLRAEYSDDNKVYASNNGTGLIYVEPYYTTVTIGTINAYVLDSIKINSTITTSIPILYGNVTYTIYNKDTGKLVIQQTFELGDGNKTASGCNATLDFVFTSSGSYNLTVNYSSANNTYSSSTSTISFQISPRTSYLTINPISTNTTKPVNITAIVKDKQGNNATGGTVTFYDNSVKIGTVTLDGTHANATLSYTFTDAYTHVITAKYTNNTEVYTDTSQTYTATINTENINIAMDPINTNATRQTTINITVNDAVDGTKLTKGNVTIYDNGNKIGTYIIDTNNNPISIQYTFADANTHTITATYKDNDNTYTNTTKTFTPTLKTEDTNINIDAITANATKTTKIITKVTDINGNNVVKGTVYFYDNDKLIGTVKLDGINNNATLSYAFSDANTHVVTAKYTDTTGTYTDSNNVSTASLTTENIIIVTPTVTNSTLHNVIINTTITDMDGIKLTKGNVTFILYYSNGTEFITLGPVDIVNGIANVTYNFNYADKYTVKTVYNDTTNTYTNTTNSSSNADILTMNIKITTTNIVNSTLNTTTFSTVIKDADGKNVTKGNVTFIIVGSDGKELTRLNPVNIVNGKASITYIFPYNDTYTVYTQYNDTGTYTNTTTHDSTATISKINTVITTIDTIKDLTLNNTLINATIIDANGNKVTKGNMSFAIIDSNGNVVDTIIGVVSDGKVGINYAFNNTGIYTVKTTFSDDNGTYADSTNRTVTTITVTYMPTFISVPILTNTTLNRTNITVNIVDVNNQPVREGNVTFTIKDSNGNIITDANGTIINKLVVEVKNGQATLPNVNITTNGVYSINATYTDDINTYSNSTNTTSKLTIFKRNTTIVINDLTNSTLNDTYINVTVFDQYGDIVTKGNITFTISNTTGTYTVTVPVNTTGGANITYDFIYGGSYTVKTEYTDISNTYNSTTNSSTAIISVIKTIVSVDDVTNSTLNTTYITATVKTINNENVLKGNVNFTITDKDNSIVFNKIVSINNGKATVTCVFNYTDNYKISVTYNDTVNTYDNSTNTTAKAIITLMGTNSTVAYVHNSTLNTTTIVAKILDNSGNKVTKGNVTFIITGVTNNEVTTLKTTITTAGTATVTNKFSYTDNYTVEVKYDDGNGTYDTSTNTTSKIVEIFRIGTTVTIPSVTNATLNTTYITAKIVDANGIGVTKGNVTFNITDSKGNVIYTETVTTSDGNATINHVFGTTGTYTVKVNYDDGNYTYANSTKTVNTLVITTTPTFVTVTDVTNSTLNKTYISAVVKNATGDIVKTGTVTFGIYNGTQLVTTLTATMDTDGNFVANYIFNYEGTYNVKTSYTNNSETYNNSYTTSKVTIITTDVSITKMDDFKNITVNKPVLNTTVTYVHDGQILPVTKGNVTFIIYNGTKEVTKLLVPIGADGTASTTYKFMYVGTYTIATVYTDNGTFTNSKVEGTTATIDLTDTKTIVINPITDVTLNSTYINTTIYDFDGNIVSKGNVTFVIKDGDNVIASLDTSVTEQGKAGVYYNFTYAGTYKIETHYYDNGTYKDIPLTSTTTATITTINTTLNTPTTITDTTLNKTYINTTLFDYNGYKVTKGNVTFTIYDSEGNEITTLKTTTNTLGQANVTYQFIYNGTYYLKTVYDDGNGTYSMSTNSTVTKMTIKSIGTTVTTPSITNSTLNTTVITTTIKDVQNRDVTKGNVTFIVYDSMGKEVTKLNTTITTAGTASVNCIFNVTDTYTVKTVYDDGNGTYANSENKTVTTITISRIITTIGVPSLENTTFNSTSITVTVVDANGVNVNFGNVTFIINDHDYGKVLVSDGKATLNGVVINVKGVYTIYTTFTDLNGTYNTSTNSTSKLTINARNTTVQITDLADVTYNSTRINVTVYDQYGELVKYGNVSFTITNSSNVVVKTFTDVSVGNDGTASVNYNFTNEEQYTIAVHYTNANGTYNESLNSSIATLKVIDTAVSVNDVTNRTLNNTFITAIVKNANGYDVLNGNVIFTIINSTTTDVVYTITVKVLNGKATMNNTFIIADTYRISAEYKDTNNTYGNSTNTTAKASILLRNTNSTIAYTTNSTLNTTSITAKITDMYNEAVKYGNVTFIITDIDGNEVTKLYTTISTAGIASVNCIFNYTGNYTVKVQYDDGKGTYNSSTNITSKIVEILRINTAVTTPSITNSTLNTTVITTKIVDANNKLVTKGNVTFIVYDSMGKEVTKLNTTITTAGTASVNCIFNVTDTYTVKTVYDDGNGTYANSENKTVTTITISRIITTIGVPSLENTTFNSTSITVTVVDANGVNVNFGNVTFIINDHDYGKVLVSDGKATLNGVVINVKGVYTIYTTFTDLNGTYNTSTNSTSKLTINARNTTVQITDLADVTYNSTRINVTVYDQYGELVKYGNVSFTITNSSNVVVKTFTDVSVGNDGTASVNYNFTNEEQYTIAVHYTNANGTYNESLNSSIATLKVISTIVSVEDVTNRTLNNTFITATIKDVNGYNVLNGNMVFTIKNSTTDDVIYTVTVPVSNGKATMNNIFTVADTYRISAEYKDTNNTYGNSTNTTAKASILLRNTNISVPDISNSTLNTTSITVKVTDMYGEAVKYGNVTFIVNGKTTVIAVSAGSATLTGVKFTEANIYSIQTSYADNTGTYNISSNNTAKAVISPIGTTINMPTVTDTTLNDTFINVTITDANGNKVQSGNVTFTITDNEGTVLNSTTVAISSDGTASMTNMFNDVGIYTLNVTLNDTDLTYSNKTIKSNVITIGAISTMVKVPSLTNTTLNKTSITVNVTDANGDNVKSGNVAFIVNGINYGNVAVDSITGQATLTGVTFTVNGTYLIVATYTDTKNTYATSTNNTVYLNILKRNTTVVLSDLVDSTYNDTVINVTVYDQYGELVKEGNIIFIITEDRTSSTYTSDAIAVDSSTGKAKITYNFEYSGSYTIKAQYGEISITSTYNNTLNSSKATIDLTGTHMDIRSVTNSTLNTTYITAEVIHNGKLIPTGAGNVTFNITDANGVLVYTEKVEVINGIAIINKIFDTEGTYHINATFNATTNNYDNVTNNKATVTITKMGTTISVPNIVNSTLNKTSITVDITDDSNNKVTKGNVTFTIDGVSKVVEVKDGKATLNDLVFTTAGEHTLYVSYNDQTNTYADSSNDTSIATISTIDTTITMPTDFTDSTLNGTYLNVTITDANGNPVTKGNVTFTITDNNGNSVDITVPVNSTGGANTTYDFIKSGEYTVSVKYNDTTNTYKNITSTTSTKIKVSTINTNVVISSVSGNATKTTQITATITDSNNKPVTSGNVTFTIEGKDITVPVVNGIATTDYTFATAGDYIINAKYNDTDSKYTNNTAKDITASIVTEDINMAFSYDNKVATKDTTFIVNVTDAEGKIVTKGNVTFVIRDSNNNIIKTAIVEVNATTGKANYTYVFSSAGTYNVETIYNDTDNTYTNITTNRTVNMISPILNTMIVTNPVFGLTYSPIAINVTVKDITEGTIVNIGNVTFTIDNNNITVAINEDGTAFINYTFTKQGVYTITLHYIDVTIKYSNSINYTVATISSINTTMNTNVTNGSAMGNTTISVNITDSNGNPVENGTVIFYDENGTNIGNATVTDGIATGNVTFTTDGNYTITVKYNGTDGYNPTESKVNVTISKMETSIVVNPVSGIVKDIVTLQANITDIYGNPVISGRVVFKMNGTTINGTDGKTLYVNVVNGVAKTTYTIPYTWAKDNLTFTAVYSGTQNAYNSATGNSSVDVIKRTANVTVTVSPVIVKAESVATYVAYVVDMNGTLVKSGKVVFKFQDHTIIDANGNPILINITNGIAKLNYRIPDGISGQNYTITAVYGDNSYYRSEGSTIQSVNKTDVIISLNPISGTSGENVTVTGLIKDIHGNIVNGTSKIAIKVDGKTIVTNVTVSNGKINITIILPKTNSSTYNITVVTGERLAYYSSRTTEIVKNMKSVAKIIVVANPTIVKAESNVNFTATIVDQYGELVKTGKVVFKVSGHTIMDNNGNPIKINVVNGTASINYTTLYGMSGHGYVISAVYYSSTYGRLENTTTIQVNKTNTKITLNSMEISSGNQLTVIASILDIHDKLINGTSKIAIKVNGKTIITNKTVTGGKINITITIPVNKHSTYNITVVTGERLAYYSSRVNGTIKTNNTIKSIIKQEA